MIIVKKENNELILHIYQDAEMSCYTLEKLLTDLKEKYRNEKDQTLREKYRQDAESLEYFTSMIAASQSRVFDFQMQFYIYYAPVHFS